MLKKMINFFLLLLLTLAFYFIAPFNILKAEEKPFWIDNPGDGSVGSSPLHVRGRHAQEELAISRARTRLASRLGVEVTSINEIQESVINNNSYITAQRNTVEKIENKIVKATVRAVWHDRVRDIFYAWVYPIK
jgi:hypothetical protein